MLVEMLFECGRSDGTEVALRLCIITDLTWDFEPPPGEVKDSIIAPPPSSFHFSPNFIVVIVQIFNHRN
jgi:hypothetical protein